MAKQSAWGWRLTLFQFFSRESSRGFEPIQPTPPATYILSRWLFLRLLGLVYLLAFVSLWMQVHGLVGSRGILPATDLLKAAQEQLGGRCYWQFPSLFWLSSSDAALNLVCAAGTLLSLLLIIGLAPIPVLILLWFTYLSLSVIGQVFLSFQWDALLLETGFFAIFFAPATLLPRMSRERPPSTLARWALWWLLFKLMFLSGITKLLSGDPTWRDLTAMNFHYQTQPIPNWVSWYVYQLPEWCQKTMVVLTFVMELIVPFFIFATRRLRHAAGAAMILLQVVIQLTGNFGFFNLLTAVLCIPLLDDTLLRQWAPRRWTAWLDVDRPGVATPMWRRRLFTATVSMLLLVSGLTFVREMVRTGNPQKLANGVQMALDATNVCLLSWGEPYVLRWTAPLRTINGYGLFRVMTTERPEIVIEASSDGNTWSEVPFRWKPGSLKRSPPIVAPYMPRLDWQMWFAALNPQRNQRWLAPLMQRLLEGSPEVIDLVGENPLPDGPPRFVRLAYYRYEFTEWETRRATGEWWQRTHLGYLTRRISLPPTSDVPEPGAG